MYRDLGGSGHAMRTVPVYRPGPSFFFKNSQTTQNLNTKETRPQMKNQNSKGTAVDVVAPSGGTTSGVGCLIASLFGIAATTVVAGANVVLWTRGAFHPRQELRRSVGCWLADLLGQHCEGVHHQIRLQQIDPANACHLVIFFSGVVGSVVELVVAVPLLLVVDVAWSGVAVVDNSRPPGDQRGSVALRQRLQNIVHGGFLGPQSDLESLRRQPLDQPCFNKKKTPSSLPGFLIFTSEEAAEV
jgi:hypothetical protein